MAKKTATMCIETNDFEEAKFRFDNAYRNWKEHWFNACYEIAKKCQCYLEEYGFDFDEIAIFPLGKKVNKNNSGNAYVYLIKMFDDNGNFAFLKIGKTNDLSRRYRELRHSHYAGNINIIWTEEIKTWELPSDFLAVGFEHILHHFLLTENLTNVPNDRWIPTELTAEQFLKMDEKYEKMCQLI